MGPVAGTQGGKSEQPIAAAESLGDITRSLEQLKLTVASMQQSLTPRGTGPAPAHRIDAELTVAIAQLILLVFSNP
jgi:hypothetical protein